MILEEQLNESSSQSMTLQKDVNVPPANQDNSSKGSDNQMHLYQKDAFFLAKVRLLISLNISLSSLTPCSHVKEKE